jgi:hypothetical protein
MRWQKGGAAHVLLQLQEQWKFHPRIRRVRLYRVLEQQLQHLPLRSGWEVRRLIRQAVDKGNNRRVNP